jgi:hypothetical protein
MEQGPLGHGIGEERLVGGDDDILRLHPEDKVESRKLEFFGRQRHTRVESQKALSDRHRKSPDSEFLDRNLLGAYNCVLTKLRWDESEVYVNDAVGRSQNVTPGCEYSRSLATSSIRRSFRKMRFVISS